jgi:hypothetical protein
MLIHSVTPRPKTLAFGPKFDKKSYYPSAEH